MPRHDWDQRYVDGDLPWDTGVAEQHLVELVERGELAPGRALEVGCGTGTNAIWLAQRGFSVVALDVSTRAIERAREKVGAAGVQVDLAVLDFLTAEVTGGPFDLVFDRGVFHVFDDHEDRVRFASRVARLLGPRGRWVSLIGSTEGPEREFGPPRRSARDITSAVEPALELLGLRSTEFRVENPARAWLMLAGQRAVPAQPSTRRPQDR